MECKPLLLVSYRTWSNQEQWFHNISSHSSQPNRGNHKITSAWLLNIPKVIKAFEKSNAFLEIADFDCVYLIHIAFLFTRWHSRTVLWPVKVIWVWRLSSRVKLLVPRWLCRPWKAITRDDMPPTSLQNQISWKFLFTPRQPRMC